MKEPLPLLRTILRLLTFRLTQDEFERLDLRFLGVGLVGTWLVGMGRWWDAPVASIAQRLGVGSLVYVFALGLLLYLAALPLRPVNWTYQSVITFVTLTSFPAALYALPVEQWVSMDDAIRLNLAFLIVVAVYRVALYLFFMARSSELGPLAALSAVFLPITLIIGVVTLSGYSNILLDVMGGLRHRDKTSMDGVANALVNITTASCLSIPVWLIIYAILIVSRCHKRGRREDWD